MAAQHSCENAAVKVSIAISFKPCKCIKKVFSIKLSKHIDFILYYLSMQTDIIKIGPSQNASPKLCPATDSLTGVKCRATSVAKNWGQRRKGKVTILNTPGRIFCQPSPDFKYFVSHCAIHKLKSRDSTKCSAILLGAKSVWEIWSKILNQNLIHKTSFKVSTSRVPFPTNRREKLRQRRRTKLQSQLLPAEYFVSHCAIHHLAESPNFKNLF